MSRALAARLERSVPLARALCLALPLGACTTVTIHAGDGTTTVERRFGFASVTIAPGATPVATEMSTLGVSSGPAGFALGWSTAQFVALPEGCRVVLWVHRPEQVEAFRQLTTGQPGLCTLNLNPKEISK